MNRDTGADRRCHRLTHDSRQTVELANGVFERFLLVRRAAVGNGGQDCGRKAWPDTARPSPTPEFSLDHLTAVLQHVTHTLMNFVGDSHGSIIFRLSAFHPCLVS